MCSFLTIMPRRKRTVAIVEDDRDTANIWQRKLTRSGFDLVGVYDGAKLAWAHLHLAPPDVLVLDWELKPGPNGDWLLDQFTRAQLPTRVLVVTGHDYDTVQTAAFAHGAHGFLGKPFFLAELAARLREVLQGKVPLSTHNGEFLKRQVCTSPCAAWQQLSPQQQRIVQLAAAGKGNKEIGAVMQRSKSTIEEQKRRIFAKLGTRDIKQVIALCAEGLRPPPSSAPVAQRQAA
jgi:two-component system nitrate/nitrite response regulator NarL